MKKIVALSLICVLALGMLCGCQSKEPKEEEPLSPKACEVMLYINDETTKYTLTTDKVEDMYQRVTALRDSAEQTEPFVFDGDVIALTFTTTDTTDENAVEHDGVYYLGYCCMYANNCLEWQRYPGSMSQCLQQKGTMYEDMLRELQEMAPQA